MSQRKDELVQIDTKALYHGIRAPKRQGNRVDKRLGAGKNEWYDQRALTSKCYWASLGHRLGTGGEEKSKRRYD